MNETIFLKQPAQDISKSISAVGWVSAPGGGSNPGESPARGGVRQDSDIDLVLLCPEYESYLEDVSWINDFDKPVSVRLKDYGKLTSVRVFYEEGPQVEFGFTQLDWLVLPLDAGTVGVLRNGFQIVYDSSRKYLALELPP